MKKIVVLTGAGVSAESGVSTFRDSNGLWENHDIMDVASPEGFSRNPALVFDFYNQRRRQLKEVQPNAAHYFIKMLEDNNKVVVITQNVDDLHERAGSESVLHLHGELRKARSVQDENLIVQWEDDLNLGDLASDGAQLRPHIVWFGEMVPMMEKAIEEVGDADVLIVIGTSLMVYPAASLLHYLPEDKPIYLIDPNWEENNRLGLNNLTVIKKKATEGVKEIDFLL